MSTKPGKLTAGKARERIASLEESVLARQHRLEQLDARLERSESHDERLLTARTRLARRLALEKEQLEKLLKLLERNSEQTEESSEFFGSEEIDDLHRSFEEVRQNLSQMQARLESSEIPRDLPGRLTSFEERMTRREEVDSELFGQLLALQTALDQERQAVRRLSRRTREQDQSLDALREAVEDSVVATVDMAERLEELEEAISESAEARATAFMEGSAKANSQAASPDVEAMRELLEEARRGLTDLQRQVEESLPAAAAQREELRAAEAAFSKAQEQAQDGVGRPGISPGVSERLPPQESFQQASAGTSLARTGSDESPAIAALMARLEALELAGRQQPAAPPPANGPTKPLEQPAAGTRQRAVFAKAGSPSKQVALFDTRPARSD